MKKRLAFTLLEIVLSLPLIFLLFSFLIMMLTASTKHQYNLQEKEKKVLQKHYFQKSLQKKLSMVTEQKELPGDYLKSNEVFFNFNNGISKEKELSGTLVAKLHLEDHNLMLSLYQKKNKALKEVRDDALLNEVQKIHFEYFFEKNKLETKNYPCPYELVSQANDSSAKWVALKCHIQFLDETKREFFFTLPRGGS